MILPPSLSASLHNSFGNFPIFFLFPVALKVFVPVFQAMVLRKSFLTAIPVSYFCNDLLPVSAGISLQTLSHFSVHEKTCQRSPPVLRCPVISDSSKPLCLQTFHKSCIFHESLSELFSRPDFVQNMPGILFLSSQVLPVHSHSSPFSLFFISLTAFLNYLTSTSFRK